MLFNTNYYITNNINIILLIRECTVSKLIGLIIIFLMYRKVILLREELW